jgi:hypothetical protein
LTVSLYKKEMKEGRLIRGKLGNAESREKEIKNF